MSGFRIYSAILLIVFLLVAACVKEVDQFIPYEDDTLNSLIKDLSDPADTTILKANRNGQTLLQSKEGFHFLVSEDIFEYEDGSDCICEDLSLEVVNLSKKGQFITYQIPTNSDQEILDGHFVINIQAWDGTKKLKLKEDYHLPIYLASTQRSEALSIYYGKTRENLFKWESLGTDSLNQAIEYGVWEINQEEIKGYKFNSEQLNWVSLQRKLDVRPTQKVCLTLPENHHPNNTLVFAFDRESRAALRFNTSGSDDLCASLPPGMEMLIVGINRTTAGQYSLSLSEVLTSPSNVIDLEFDFMSLSDIRSLLQSL